MSLLGRRRARIRAVPVTEIKAALANRYHIQSRVGGGGAADVFSALDRRDNQRVAIKIYSGVCADGIGAERFLREIEVTARLNHPNILPVLASGADAGLLYYVMPFAESGGLAHLMARKGRLSVARVCQILGELARGLSYAHVRSIVHRDIKPENVMFIDGRALLADFGIAKLLSGGSSLSFGGIPLGTPDFMAPEQVLSRPVDPRTDIYALGVLGYEMLIGDVLFPGKNTMQVMAAHVSQEPPDMQSKRSDLSLDLVEVIRKCLRKHPDNRWQDVDDLARAVSAVRMGFARRSDDTGFMPVLAPRVSLS